MKKLFKILSIIAFLLPVTSFAEVENIGIIKGIWFSDTEFTEGESMRIYTAIQNNSGGDVEGSIEFYRESELLGSKKFSALNNRIIESWVDTSALAGTHEFSVKIIEVSKNPIGGSSVSIVAQSTFSESVAVVKKDLDRDLIPDEEDEDDDGDGVSDILENEEGTDPLDKDSFPVEKKDENNDENKDEDESNKDSVIEDLKDAIASLLGKNKSENKNPPVLAEDKAKEEKVVDGEDQDGDSVELEEKTPEIALSLSEDNKFLRDLVLEISSMQEKTHSYAEKTKENNSKKLEIIESKNTKLEGFDSPSSVGSEAEDNSNKTKKMHGFALWLYGIILAIFEFLSRSWWFVVVFLFLGVYLAIKILFKIFGKKSE